MKKISVVTPCYNEEANAAEAVRRVREVFAGLPGYDYEHLFIDNASTDRTVEILKGLAAADKRVKLIVNSRNFGQVRSPFHAYLQASGDAVVPYLCDLQEPAEVIPEFVRQWEKGYRIVLGIKESSHEGGLMRALRLAYYRFVRLAADIELVENFYGFGLYDRQVIEVLRTVNDPYPYFRGLIFEIGFEKARVPFRQAARAGGRSKNNFFTLYDIAMQGLTAYSKVPLRLAALAGFVIAALSVLAAAGYLVYKLLFWDKFAVGMAPVVIGLFFFSSVQLFFIGLLGEYLAAVHAQVLRRPLVIEKERVNF